MNRPTSPASAFPEGAALIAAVLAFGAYFVVLHALIVRRTIPWLVLAMVLAPWFVAIAALTAKRWRSSPATVRTAIATIALLAVVAVAGVSSAHWTALVANADLVVYLENALFFAWLSVLFAVSLTAPREPLVTRMARKVRRGDMPPEVVRYTRLVTLAWTIFFAAVIGVSTLLYFGGYREAWSLFVNLLIWPLLVVCFVVEYAIRVTVLRHVHHVPLMSGVRAFRDRDVAGETASRR